MREGISYKVLSTQNKATKGKNVQCKIVNIVNWNYIYYQSDIYLVVNRVLHWIHKTQNQK